MQSELHQAVLLLLLGFFQPGGCIKCMQCTTLRDKGCESGRLSATECNPTDNFCLKYIGRVNAGSIVFRGCNKKPIEPVCTMRMIENQHVRVCYETCNTTACNGGPISSSALPGCQPRATSGTCWLFPVTVTITLALAVFGQHW